MPACRPASPTLGLIDQDAIDTASLSSHELPSSAVPDDLQVWLVPSPSAGPPSVEQVAGLPGKEIRELCEQNSHEKDIQREGGGDVQAHGGCEAAPKDADAISQEPSPPTAVASAECEAESELSIPEGSDPLSLVQVRDVARVRVSSFSLLSIQWYSLDSSLAEAPRRAASAFSGTIQPMPPIFRVGSHLHRIFYTSNSKP